MFPSAFHRRCPAFWAQMSTCRTARGCIWCCSAPGECWVLLSPAQKFWMHFSRVRLESEPKFQPHRAIHFLPCQHCKLAQREFIIRCSKLFRKQGNALLCLGVNGGGFTDCMVNMIRQRLQEFGFPRSWKETAFGGKSVGKCVDLAL